MKAAKRIQHKGATIHLLWAPGHTDVQGNERADYLAKEAAKEEPSTTTVSLAFIGTQIRAIQQREQRREYQTYKDKAILANNQTYAATYLLKLSKTIQTPRETKREITSAFYSLKLGHGYFNSYLTRFQKRDSSLCSCGSPQTPKHLLLSCRLYRNERKTLQHELRHTITLPLLLHTKAGVEATIAFIQSTRIGTRQWHLGQETET